MNLRHAVALALLLVPAVAEAQSTGGQIVGRTIDESGGPIPGAFVTLRPSRPAPGLVELEALCNIFFAFSNLRRKLVDALAELRARRRAAK